MDKNIAQHTLNVFTYTASAQTAPEAGVLMELSLAGLAQLTKVWFGISRLSWTRSPR
jgi:hypothetical protein